MFTVIKRLNDLVVAILIHLKIKLKLFIWVNIQQAGLLREKDDWHVSDFDRLTIDLFLRPSLDIKSTRTKRFENVLALAMAGY